MIFVMICLCKLAYLTTESINCFISTWWPYNYIFLYIYSLILKITNILVKIATLTLNTQYLCSLFIYAIISSFIIICITGIVWYSIHPVYSLLLWNYILIIIKKNNNNIYCVDTPNEKPLYIYKNDFKKVLSRCRATEYSEWNFLIITLLIHMHIKLR